MGVIGGLIFMVVGKNSLGVPAVVAGILSTIKYVEMYGCVKSLKSTLKSLGDDEYSL